MLTPPPRSLGATARGLSHSHYLPIQYMPSPFKIGGQPFMKLIPCLSTPSLLYKHIKMCSNDANPSSS